MGFKEKYFDIWREVWDFHKKFSEMLGTDEEWTTVIKETGEFEGKYKNTPQHEFAKQLILAVLDELERAQKAR